MFLLGLFLVVLGTSYALFSTTLVGRNKMRVKTGTFSLRLTDKDGNEEEDGFAINLENAAPTEDKVGFKSEAYEFVVENNGTVPASYNLIINSSGDMDPNFIKYSLTQKDYLKKEDGTYYMGGLYKDSVNCVFTSRCTMNAPTLGNSGEKVLHTTTLIPGEKMGYELRIWIDWEATQDDVSGKTYESNIKIDGVQSESVMTGNAGDYATYNLYKDGTLVLDGDGPVETYVDGVYIDHGGPYLDILAKYFEKNGIEKQHTDRIGSDASYFSAFLTGYVDSDYSDYHNNNIEDFYRANAYGICDGVPDLEAVYRCRNRVSSLMDNLPYHITRVVVNEGITSLKDNKDLFTLTGDYMLTLPSTLEDMDDYNSYSYNFEYYSGYALIIPPNITSIGLLGNSVSSEVFYGFYLEYIDYSHVKNIGSSAMRLNSYDRKINISDGVETIGTYGIWFANDNNPIINIPNSVKNIEELGIQANSDTIINIDNTRQFVESNWDSFWFDTQGTSTINYLR